MQRLATLGPVVRAVFMASLADAATRCCLGDGEDIGLEVAANVA
jgi:hypothetical protein